MGISLELYRARIGGYAGRAPSPNAGQGLAPAGWYGCPAPWSATGNVDGRFALTISPKLACMVLLMMAISAQCQACLLIIGAVEQNPGPCTPQDILAQLSAEAPAPDVKDCISLYDHKKDYTANKKKLTTTAVDILVRTMAYLGVPGQEVYVKTTIVHNLICRIQNLLPDTCPICAESYCVQRDELEILSCAKCGQASHTPCVLGLLGVTEEERGSFGPREAQAKMNPHNLPGIFYICKACEEQVIPSDEVGKRKKLPATSAASEDHADESASPQEPIIQDTVQPPELGSQGVDQTGSSIRQNDHGPAGNQSRNGQRQSCSVSTENQRRTGPRTNNIGAAHGHRNNQNSTQVCSYYRKGICRHGISGRGCPKLHPSSCQKLLTHGTKGPRGCNMGSRCNKFHPIMCASSLKDGTCLSKSCKLRHVKGTQRGPLDQSATTHGPGRRHQGTTVRNDSSRGTEDFLSAIAALKIELLEAMDAKLRAVIPAAAEMASPSLATAPHHMYHQMYPCLQRGLGHSHKLTAAY